MGVGGEGAGAETVAHTQPQTLVVAVALKVAVADARLEQRRARVLKPYIGLGGVGGHHAVTGAEGGVQVRADAPVEISAPRIFRRRSLPHRRRKSVVARHVIAGEKSGGRLRPERRQLKAYLLRQQVYLILTHHRGHVLALNIVSPFKLLLRSGRKCRNAHKQICNYLLFHHLYFFSPSAISCLMSSSSPG